MIVDWHAHVYPPELAKERRWGGASPLTIENLLEAHERAGIDLCGQQYYPLSQREDCGGVVGVSPSLE